MRRATRASEPAVARPRRGAASLSRSGRAPVHKPRCDSRSRWRRRTADQQREAGTEAVFHRPPRQRPSARRLARKNSRWPRQHRDREQVDQSRLIDSTAMKSISWPRRVAHLARQLGDAQWSASRRCRPPAIMPTGAKRLIDDVPGMRHPCTTLATGRRRNSVACAVTRAADACRRRCGCRWSRTASGWRRRAICSVNCSRMAETMCWMSSKRSPARRRSLDAVAVASPAWARPSSASRRPLRQDGRLPASRTAPNSTMGG